VQAEFSLARPTSPLAAEPNSTDHVTAFYSRYLGVRTGSALAVSGADSLPPAAWAAEEAWQHRAQRADRVSRHGLLERADRHGRPRARPISR
jgi:hypothetical protein